jgi:hypothetical protein
MRATHRRTYLCDVTVVLVVLALAIFEGREEA